MNLKRKDVLDRIQWLEEAIDKARACLETGANATWAGFGPWLEPKVRDGKRMPPHRDWVRHVFLRRCEKSLARAKRILEKLDEKENQRRDEPPQAAARVSRTQC